MCRIIMESPLIEPIVENRKAEDKHHYFMISVSHSCFQAFFWCMIFQEREIELRAGKVFIEA